MGGNGEKLPSRDSVFTAAGQPSITYVDRAHLQIEGKVAAAIKAPNQIVSLAGPSKSGKTVLCRKVLSNDQYVWLEAGQIDNTKELWDRICYELNYPKTVTKSATDTKGGTLKIGLKFLISAEGSRLRADKTDATYEINSMSSAIRHLQEEKISLVIDDFHYLDADTRKKFLRNIKGPVFNGLKLVLISVTHRGHDAVKAETELQGRVQSVFVPDWDISDLQQIAAKGFGELNIECPQRLINRLSEESQKSPSLMQKLCWEICVGLGVDEKPKKAAAVSDTYDLIPICKRIAQEAGHPIYQKLEVGPQNRKPRMKRQLKSGGAADIYRVILMGLAATGPEPKINYDTLREKMAAILVDEAPQKHEITSALKHLARISQNIGNDAGIDWDEDGRRVDISDPYLRFYLRWQIRPVSQVAESGGALVRFRLSREVAQKFLAASKLLPQIDDGLKPGTPGKTKHPDKK